jgi:hypothetical protein
VKTWMMWWFGDIARENKGEKSKIRVINNKNVILLLKAAVVVVEERGTRRETDRVETDDESSG